jgi:iron complex transport system permease protein
MMSRHQSMSGARVVSVSLGMTAALGVCLVLGLSFGAGSVSPADLLQGAGELERAILLEVRLPRVIVAGLLGGALSIAGVVFQALLRNPLADPYVLGVAGGASIGGVLALVLGFGAGASWIAGLAVPAFAFAGALGALLLIQWIATVNGRLTVYTIILTGAIFNAFAAAVIYFIQSIASLNQLHDIVFYLMGRVPSLSASALAGLGLVIALGALCLYLMSRDYNALSLGEDAAMSLGVDVERTKRYTFVVGSLLTGLCVAVAGLIGFVGLVIPHMLRLIVGPDHRVLLPAAFLGGAGFLILADLLARVILAPNEMPVGVLTALVGGPFFLYLLRTRARLYGI